MTTPGSGEGVSWIDVAASAAGIEAQMRQIGAQAAGAFSQEFNQRLGATMRGGSENTGRQTGSHFGAALNEAAAKAFNSGPLKDALGGLSKLLGPEASVAGGVIGGALTEGLVRAASAGIELIRSDISNTVNFANHEVAAFGKVGKDAADSLMSGFTSVMAGRMPDAMRVFDVMEEGVRASLEAPLNAVNLAVDNTVGHVPVIGDVFKTALSEAESAFGGLFSAFDEAKELGGEFAETMVEVGDQWAEAARKVAGQTLDSGQLSAYLGIVRDIAASGDLAHFDDAADSIGLLGQRLSTLGEGAGLSNQQLEELTRTLAGGNELLGLKIDVNALTAAFNDFNVEPEKTAEELNLLINVARMTGDNINSLVANVNTLGPAMEEMGYSLDQVAFFAGRMNQELGPTQTGRMVSSFVQVEDHLKKQALSWQDAIEIVKEYHKASDDAAAVDYLKGLGASSKSALLFVKLINEGILSTPEALQQAIDGSAAKLHQPFEQVLSNTRDLQDTLNEVSNQLKAAFAGIGVPLIEGLNGAADRIKSWLAENQDKVLHWGGEIMVAILRTFSTITTDVGRALYMVAPVVQEFKTFVVETLKQIDVALQGVLKPFALLPDWAGGHIFKEMSKDLADATGPLSQLAGVDLTAGLQGAAKGLMEVGAGAAGAIDPLSAYMTKAEDAARINEALSQSFSAKPGDKPAYQEAFGSDKDGLKLLAGADWDTIAGKLAKLGIHLDFDKITGQIRGFTTDTKAEADALSDYLKSKFGEKAWADLQPKVKVDVVPAPPLTDAEARAKLGLPSEVPVPVIPQPQGGQWSPQPPTYGPPLPPGGDVTLPPRVGNEPAPRLPVTQSGYTTTGGLVGIVLPTSLNVRDPAERKTLSQVMAAVGIPDSLQGTDGVTIPVGFDVQNMPALSLPTGYGDSGGLPGGPGGSPMMPSGPSIRNVNWAAIAGAESGGDWHIDHGEGTPDNPVTGGLQIGDKTWRDFGGTRYAPRAFMATPEEQIEIAEKVLAAQGPGAWPVTSRNHPDWFGSPGPTGDAGAGGGDYGASAGHPTIAPPDENAIRGWVQQNFGIPNTFGTGTWENSAHEDDHKWHHPLPGMTDYKGPVLPTGGEKFGYAFDFHGTTEQMDALANWIAEHWAKDTLELIHQGPGFDTSREISNGRFGDVFGPALDAEHRDHVHWAMTLPPYALSGFTMPQGAPHVSLADWHGDGNAVGAGYGLPAAPAPNTPGSDYGSVPPPPGMQPAPPGTPGAIHTPYGDFQYTWDMPADQQRMLTPEQRQKFDEWLHKQETQTEQQNQTQADIDAAKRRLEDLRQTKKKADDDLADLDRQIQELAPAEQEKRRAAEDYQKAKQKAEAADRAFDDAQRSLDNATRRQHDQDVQGHISAESPPPWENKGPEKYDKDAETMGKGLVKGIFQELGFPDVFGKPPTQWGIWKLAMGGLGFGAGLVEQKYGGGSTGSAGSAPGSGGVGNVIASLFHGLGGALGQPQPRGAQVGWQPPNPNAVTLPQQPQQPGQRVIPAALAPPTLPNIGTPDYRNPVKPVNFKPAENWIPGGLNPGLHMASPAEMIAGTSASIAGLFGSLANTAVSSFSGAGGAPTPPANLTSGVQASPPPTAPAPPDNTNNNSGGTSLSITYDQRGAWQPTPQMKDDVRDIAYTTSAPAMAGGAGIPT